MRPAECNIQVDHFITVLGEILYTPQKTINQDTHLADLGLDSLDLIQAALELEAILGCEVPDGTLAAARTVGDLAACFHHSQRGVDVLRQHETPHSGPSQQVGLPVTIAAAKDAEAVQPGPAGMAHRVDRLELDGGHPGHP